MNYMKQAINLAKKAASHQDVPIGAVIVKDGIVIARAENMVQLKSNPILHAEIVAIQRACRRLKTKFLYDCDIYITLEPCAMCATAISLARIQNIYFAAPDIKGGGILTNAQVYKNDKHLWKPNVSQMSEYANESAELLKSFFQQRRKPNDTVIQ